MWFRNLRIYPLQQPFNLTAEALGNRLEQKRFKPCGSHDVLSYGWYEPLGRQGEQLVHELIGCQMICARREEKLLPSAVVNEIVDEKAAAIEAETGTRPGRKVRGELREEIFQQLLPQAFSRFTTQYAMIDKQQGWILVDAASANKAEAFVSLLRETLGSLPAKPLEVSLAPSFVMTEWLRRPASHADFELLDSCELKDRSEDPGVLRCKGQDLGAEEMLAHLDAGKDVVKLSVSWDERLSCVIESDLSIKRLRFLDLIQNEAADYQTENTADAFDAHFSLMTLEFRRFVPRLIELFGGAVETEKRTA
ncbi:MAG: recombination-associated protein RdgC [Candidatus Thiodiazotropha sp.]